MNRPYKGLVPASALRALKTWQSRLCYRHAALIGRLLLVRENHRLSRWFSLTNQMTGCAWARPVFPCRKFHMDIDLPAYWAEVLRQDAQVIETFLAPNAVVNWHCTNEHFTAAEFIRANCEYPGH